MRHKYFILRIIVLFFSFGFVNQTNFKANQLVYPKVKQAFSNQEVDLKTLFRLNKINPDECEVYIRGFKKEGTLELWARNRTDKRYSYIESYPFCSNVGVLGPKRREGDNQIPEGFYNLSSFNPNSNYHLSLQVSYPNKSDSILSKHKKLGGLIFIHGGCQTIGCIPIMDDKIERLYVSCVLARSNGQIEIPIHIFPNRMNYSNYKSLLNSDNDKSKHVFWTNLKPVYQHFEETGELLTISVNHQGRYLFK